MGATVSFNGIGTTWSQASDWSSNPSLPQATDDLLFSNGYATTLDTSITIQSLGFDIGSGTASIDANATGAAGQTLILNGDGGGSDALGNSGMLIDLSAATTGTVNIGVANGVGTTNVALGASGAFAVNNPSATLNFGANSVISGAFNLTVGGGTIILAGPNTFGGMGNSFSLIGSGTLDINNASALGNSANTFNISGGTIDNTSGAAITTSNYAQTWSGDFSFNGTNALNLGTGAVSTGSSMRTVTVNGTGTNGTLTVGGIVSGTGGLTKAGTGTLVLTGANTYTGGTKINAGKLQIGNGSSNGTLGSGTYVIASGATLNWKQGTTPSTNVPWANISGAGTFSLDDATTSGAISYANIALPSTFTGTLVLNEAARPTITLASNLGNASTIVITGSAQLLLNPATTGVTLTQSFSIGGIGSRSDHPDGAIRSTGSAGTPTNTISGNITLLSNSGLLTQGNHANNLVITGIIADGGNGYNLAINPEASTESITLSGANTYSGQTTMSGTTAVGKLVLNNSLALQNSTLSISAGSLSFSSSVSSHAFTLGGLSGSIAIGLSDSSSNAVALTVGNNNSSTSYSGVLSGSGSLSKIGSGTLTLSGASTYGGTTAVSVGTLLVTGSISGSTTVGSGATLGGNGSVSAVTVNSGGTITTGATVDSIGTLNTGTLNLGGTYNLTLNSTTNVTDDLNVTGDLTLSGATLTPNDLALGPAAVNLTIAQYTGSLSGTFSGLTQGASLDGGRYTIDYGTVNPNAITLIATVPEPCALASLLGGFGMLVGLKRFRRRLGPEYGILEG